MLGIHGIAGFDHAVADAVDFLFIGARFTQRFDLGIFQLQRAEAAVVVQCH
ncbi:hypothetical protein D3C85_1581770 [compost metagenome]